MTTTIRNLSESSGRVEVEFDSIASIVAAAFDPKTSRSAEGAALAQSHNRRAAFDGRWYDGANEQTCREWLNHARPHVLNAVDQMRKSLEDSLEMPTRRRRKIARHLEDGTDLDPQAWLERKPDGWSDMVKVRRAATVVKIAVNVSINCAMWPEHLLWRGAAAAAIVDIFESRGTSVELVVFNKTHTTSAYDNVVLTKVVVKESDQPMDIGSVATACAEIGFFRLVMLNAQCHSVTGRPKANCGYPSMLSPEEQKGYAVVLDTNVNTREAAVAAALKVLNAA